MPKKILLGVAAVAAVFGLVACGADGEEASEPSAQTEQQALPEPQVDDIPEVVASVNGNDISGEAFTDAYTAQFQQLAMQSQMTGEELDQNALQEQALEMMINSELLVMEAEEQEFSASEEDVDTYLSTMAEQNGLESTDELLSQFEEQGLSSDRVRAEIQREVLIEQVIDNIDVDEPSDDELRTIYDTQVEQLEALNEQAEDDQTQDIPSFDTLRPELEKQATAQQHNEALTKLIDQLREDADIEILL